MAKDIRTIYSKVLGTNTTCVLRKKINSFKFFSVDNVFIFNCLTAEAVTSWYLLWWQNRKYTLFYNSQKKTSYSVDKCMCKSNASIDVNLQTVRLLNFLKISRFSRICSSGLVFYGVEYVSSNVGIVQKDRKWSWHRVVKVLGVILLTSYCIPSKLNSKLLISDIYLLFYVSYITYQQLVTKTEWETIIRIKITKVLSKLKSCFFI